MLGTFGIVAATALIAGLVATGFDNSGPSPTADPPPVRRAGSEVDTGAVEGKPTWDAPPAYDLILGVDYGAEIELDDGTIVVIDLFEELAPEHVNNFVFLVNEGFYDGLSFHRVVPGFVAQAGDPTASGSGGAGYTLPDEIVGLGSESALSVAPIGAVAMARSDLGASSSQFFIKLGSQDHLDGQGFTAFGVVIEGLEALYAFDSRDPAAVPPPPSGPRITEIRITEAAAGVVDEPEQSQAVETAAQPQQDQSQEQAQPQTAAPTEQSEESEEPEEPERRRAWSQPPDFMLEEGIDYRATIEMADGGLIEIDLFEEIAPLHVNNFVFLARAGFYDSVTFHRIIHGFMAQGGDPTGTGSGGPGYSLVAEFSATPHERGILSMARSADPNSAGSQFFIVYEAAPHLDGQYTVFGEVLSGMDVVDAFAERNPADPSAPPGPEIVTITISEIVRAE